ncbi:MAG: cytochrome P450 [Solirubrobacteraceae bacterium]|nr:cytochrome P450 [Solirubrobacteraceae bacterium]
MIERPEPHTPNPLTLIARDLRNERAATVPYPPGDTRFSLARTRRFMRDPLGVMLDGYERHGPVFTLRILHHDLVIMLGPEANHHILVSNAHNFSWRGGQLRGLIPFLGDGLLTTDDPYHRAHRKVMVPAFHRERIRRATEIMEEEVERAATAFVPGAVLDLYAWTRDVSLRIAMRALFGLDPDLARAGDLDAAHEFEAALSFHARGLPGQLARGPGTPYARVLRSRERLDALLYGEIDRRRAAGTGGEDLLSLLIAATDEDGDPLPRDQVRDEVMTLLFAGHDTTTSTVAFLFHELAENPELAEDPGVSIEMLLAETLRKFPPAYVGPRRSIAPFEFQGVPVPGLAFVWYSSLASHRLPDVWPEPERFDPFRFTPENRARMRKGQYVPFGSGTRTCIGMRFGEAEIAVIARAILERCRLELLPGYRLDLRTAPTISPAHGLPVRVRRATVA